MADSHTLEPRRRYEMPFLLLCGLGFSAFFAALGALVLAGMVVGTLFSGGSYSVNGQAVTRAEFYAASWPVYVIFPLACALVGVIAYLLWREDPRSRHFIIGYWALCVCVSVGLAIAEHNSDAWVGVVPVVFLVILAWAYLYRKANVVAYYALLEKNHSARVAQLDDPHPFRAPGV